MMPSRIAIGAPARRQRGFTIMELLIASALALVMLAGVSGLFLSATSTEKTNAGSSELMTNGRYALDVLRSDIIHAGYRGLTYAEPATPNTALGAVTGECAGVGFVTNLRQGIWGADESNPFSTTCIPSANYSKGDVIVTRHVDLAPAAALGATTYYFRSAYETGQIFQGNALPASFTQTPRFDYPLVANVYYVNKFSVSSTENPVVPALWRVRLGAGPAMVREGVVSNVEDLAIQYGRLQTDLRSRFYNGNQINTTVTSLTATPNEWDNVTSVRVWILMRATNTEPGYINTNTYVMGNKTVTVNDNYRRELLSTVIQMRNQQ